MELGKIDWIESVEEALPGLYWVTWRGGERSEVVVADSPDNALRKIVPRESVLIKKLGETNVEYTVEFASRILGQHVADQYGPRYTDYYRVRPLRAIR